MFIPSGTSAHWALGLSHLLLVIWLSCLFTLMNHFPLRGTDLWCHVLYGQWILEHRAIPAADPFCPLATSAPVVDSVWLSQVIFALVQRAGGIDIKNIVAQAVQMGDEMHNRNKASNSSSRKISTLG